MNDLIEDCKITGQILLDGEDIYGNIDINQLRKKVGMVFQKPNPFPMSVYDNIAFGPRTHGIRSKVKLDEIVEKSLRDAAIWDELKDRLKKSAWGSPAASSSASVSPGLWPLTRTFCSWMNRQAPWIRSQTSKIEDSANGIKKNYTNVIVTHNMQQAARISDKTAFFLLGEVVEFAETETLFPCRKTSARRINYGEVRIMRNRFDEQLDD
jgi:phosphate transport system ATP-binding protein